MITLKNWKKVCAAVLFSAMTIIAAPAQTYTNLVNFDLTNGAYPGSWLSLVQGLDGNFYGTTFEGGAPDWGTVFKMTPDGSLTTMYEFCKKTGCADGAHPYSGLVQAPDGDFYGVTWAGGNDNCGVGCGTVYKITPAGKLTTLHVFDKTDGWAPYGALTQGTDGNFYGTTYQGGTYDSGTVFKITSSGTLTTLYSFDCGETKCPDGGYPYAGVVQGTDGNFYGTTYEGQNAGFYGTAFKITPAGKLSTLHTFENTDGASPFEGLVQGSDGNFYGSTYAGGTKNYGTVFKVTAGGTFTTLYNFIDGEDGGWPETGLVQATDGNFYGSTSVGGANAAGTIFSISPSGTLTTAFSGDGDIDPVVGTVMQGTDGTFYGATWNGGSSNRCTGQCGTVYSLSVGLGPFVTTLPTSGKVGAPVIILGNNLTGSTGVSFNGTAASFTVVSNSEIRTAVPTGGTTGKVEVVTPGGTLQSNVVFRVP
jgi:uncharacterized repeat protein (TIGR03803 family)